MIVRTEDDYKYAKLRGDKHIMQSMKEPLKRLREQLKSIENINAQRKQSKYNIYSHVKTKN